jgi:hypothetical protein
MCGNSVILHEDGGHPLIGIEQLSSNSSPWSQWNLSAVMSGENHVTKNLIFTFRLRILAISITDTTHRIKNVSLNFSLIGFSSPSRLVTCLLIAA